MISGLYMDTFKPGIAVLSASYSPAIQKMTQYFTDTKYKPQEIAASR